MISCCAPVAQLDRAPGFEPVGRGFKSLRARHFFSVINKAPVAQLDRVLASEAKGRRFESCQARHSGTGQEFRKSDQVIEGVKNTCNGHPQ